MGANDHTSVTVRAKHGSDITVEDVVSRGTGRAVDVDVAQLERGRIARIDHDTGTDSGGIVVAGRRVSWSAVGAIAAVLAIPVAIVIAILS